MLPREAGKLAGIPGVLIVGRLDFSSPVEAAWTMTQRWPEAELKIVEHAGHGAGPAVAELVKQAIATFADR